MLARHCDARVCAKREIWKMRIGSCLGRLAYLAVNRQQQWCAWSWENKSPCLMPWMDYACCARNICCGLDGKEVMLAHCGGKQARDQKAARGLTTSTSCRFSPHRRWRYAFYSIPLMPRKGGMVWALVIYSLNFRRWYGSPLISEPRVVFDLNNNNK